MRTPEHERPSALRERVREMRAALLVSALEQMSQPVAVFDRRYRLVCCNPAAVELLALPDGLARAGTPIREFILHQAAQGAMSVKETERRVRDLATTPHFRAEYQRHDGRIIMVRRDPLADGGFLVLFNDMTIQRGAEAALQRNERRYYAIVEDQPDLIVRFRPDGSITFANGACARFYGTRREALIGRPALDLVHPEDRESVAAYFTGDATLPQTRTIEHRAPADGSDPPRWLQRVDRAIRSATGETVEFQSVLRDVSELKLAQEVAQRVGKLTTLGQIVAGVTHELNQPLNAALLAAQNALMDLAERDEIDRAYIEGKLESLADDLRRMGRIVNHLRTFMRPSTEAGVTADLVAAIRRSVDLVSNQFGLDVIAFDLRLPEACRPAAATPIDIETVLVNLFTNARDAIRGKRRGRQDAAGIAAGRIVVTLRDLAPAPELRLTVRDNGGGIPEELIPRVFDPFVTTKEVGKGMGLGLSIVHQTVANLGGTLGVRNAHGGAEFCINIPAAEAEP